MSYSDCLLEIATILEKHMTDQGFTEKQKNEKTRELGEFVRKALREERAQVCVDIVMVKRKKAEKLMEKRKAITEEI